MSLEHEQSDADADSARGVAASERPGSRIGRYKLMQVVGQGGFGVVWMAEQEEPVRRKVALKILKLGMDTKQVVARFEAERQALALMDHPGIAMVLDGGATESGRPYFVMELVHGVPITKFCNERRLAPRARLELFRQVCAAIQHAHQKGVIHRDIKPSNVLVIEHDGAPAPKVIDFGVAKATGGSLTELTLVTELRQMIGTPEYMAPEQASASVVDVDTRADIYSLGVLLYELLTGTKPFEFKTVAELGYDEVLRHIRDVEPPKPSTRISSLGENISKVAEQRAIAPQQLRHAVRGDLDWIVMKAIEKDRARRYDSATAFADDVARYLADQPLLASPPSARYRLRKFARRNKLAFAAGTAIVVALVVGLGAATAGWFEARKQRDVAREQLERALRAEADEVRARREADAAREAEADQRQKAQANEQIARNAAAKSQQAAQFLSDMLKSVGPSVAQGRDTELLSEVLDRTAERLEGELADQPEVEAELRATIGDVYRQLGRYTEAETMQREALRLRRETAGEESEPVATSLNDVGLALFQRGDFAGAEQYISEAVEMLRQVAPQSQSTQLAMLSNLAAAQIRLAKYEEAERSVRDVATLQRELTGDRSAELADALNNLGVVLRLRGDHAAAEAALRESLEIQRAVLGDRSPNVAGAMVNLGTTLRQLRRFDEAESLMREALDLQREVLGDDHPDLSTTLNNLACVLYDRHRLDEAEPMFEDALRRRRAQYGDDNVEVARPLEWLATIATERGQLERAESFARQAVSIYERTLGDDHPDTIGALDRLAHAVERAGRLDEAEAILRRAFEASRRTPAEWLNTSPHLFCYARMLRQREQWPLAEKALLETWTRAEHRPDSVRAAAEQLAAFYDAWNQAAPDASRAAEAARWRAAASQ